MKTVNTSGKRRTSVARATVSEGKGRVKVNKIPIEIWEPEISRIKMMEVLTIAEETVKGLDIDVIVKGGGVMGQTEAARTAIGRGIIEITGDLKLKDALMAYDKTIIKGDHRRKETKKYGGPGARAKVQKSYR